MVQAGCRVALGIDGQAFDEDDDALRDMRLFWSLHAGWGFDTVLPPAEALRFTAGHGRRSVGAPGTGLIAVGEPADLMVINRATLDADDLDAEGGIGLSPLGLVFARATMRHIAEVVVAGRTVVKGGEPLGVDLDQLHRGLREALRKGLPARQRLRTALPGLEGAIAGWYAGRAGCC
jgi:cytosine/adenosine deaminase-related metal-dependent hydrolase